MSWAKHAQEPWMGERNTIPSLPPLVLSISNKHQDLTGPTA